MTCKYLCLFATQDKSYQTTLKNPLDYYIRSSLALYYFDTYSTFSIIIIIISSGVARIGEQVSGTATFSGEKALVSKKVAMSSSQNFNDPTSPTHKHFSTVLCKTTTCHCPNMGGPESGANLVKKHRKTSYDLFQTFFKQKTLVSTAFGK